MNVAMNPYQSQSRENWLNSFSHGHGRSFAEMLGSFEAASLHGSKTEIDDTRRTPERGGRRSIEPQRVRLENSDRIRHPANSARGTAKRNSSSFAAQAGNSSGSDGALLRSMRRQEVPVLAAFADRAATAQRVASLQSWRPAPPVVLERRILVPPGQIALTLAEGDYGISIGARVAGLSQEQAETLRRRIMLLLARSGLAHARLWLNGSVRSKEIW